MTRPRSPLTPEAAAEIRAAITDERLWPAPWRARTFAIECPCPNGVHCGDTHSCEEIEALEAYPCGTPGHPGAEGDGQCVVQISVPGLETFARPTARAIVALRNNADALLAAVDERDSLLTRLAALEAERDGLRGALEEIECEWDASPGVRVICRRALSAKGGG